MSGVCGNRNTQQRSLSKCSDSQTLFWQLRTWPVMLDGSRGILSGTLLSPEWTAQRNAEIRGLECGEGFRLASLCLAPPKWTSQTILTKLFSFLCKPWTAEAYRPASFLSDANKIQCLESAVETKMLNNDLLIFWGGRLYTPAPQIWWCHINMSAGAAASS